jgi:SWI/SNF-related matrix-associated actin-dependent regulator 1 of chromatin subfamily A
MTERRAAKRIPIDGDRVVVELVGWPGGDDSRAFKQTCDRNGFRYLESRKQHTGPEERVRGLVIALHRSGFDVDAPAELRQRLIDADARRAELLEGVGIRVARLRERGLELKPWQPELIEWLAPRRRALNHDDMGLGKTIENLVAMPFGVPALVPCPSAAVGVWEAETSKWRPDFRPVVIEGGKGVRARDAFRWPEPCELVIVSSASLPGDMVKWGKGTRAKLSPELLATMPEGMYVMPDEAHEYKETSADRTKRCRVIAREALKRGGCVWPMTGTPLLNQPLELWNVLELAKLAETAYGSFPRFAALCKGKRVRVGKGVMWKWAKTPSPLVAELLQRVAFGRLKEDWLDGEVQTRELVTDVGSEAMELADEVVELLRAAGIDLDTTTDILEAMRQVDIPFELLSRVRMALAIGKVPASVEYVEWLETLGEPVVFFSDHRKPVEVIGQRDGYGVIDGTLTGRQKKEVADAFQAGELRGLSCSIKAAGVALTLTRANQAVVNDPLWTPELMRQAIDRLNRIGQERWPVQVTRVVARHPLDRKISATLTHKEGLVTATTKAAARRR